MQLKEVVYLAIDDRGTDHTLSREVDEQRCGTEAVANSLVGALDDLGGSESYAPVIAHILPGNVSGEWGPCRRFHVGITGMIVSRNLLVET